MMRFILLLLAVAALLLPPNCSLASTGGTALLPLPQPLPPGGKKPKPNPRALLVKIDTTWVDCNGYRPVRVTITPKPPLAADRTITVRFRPGGWGGMYTRMSLTQDVELPAGATSVTTVLAVPQLEAWNTFSFDVFDDGVPVEELSVGMYRLTINANNPQWGDGSSPNMLLLGAPKLPGNTLQPFSRGDESVIQMGLPPATITQGAVTRPLPTATRAGANRFAGMSGIPSHAQLPTRWIDYSGLDIVYVELPELEQFVQENPEQWKAIREWLAAGGNLWVGAVGKQWQRIGQLEKLLEMPVSDEGVNPPGWAKPDAQQRYQSLRGLNQSYAANTPETPADRSPQEEPLFRTRSLGRGQVMAFGHDDPLTEIQHAESWNWIYNTAGPERWSWYRRHGISLQQANREFWDFLIPGVGLAPVTEFQVLITLFVLAIGPLNYYLLRRWQKLNLIMITVPVSALAVTGTLLLYALVADGLGVRTRARSFTEIDQRRGEAVCWARLSYYAGLRPSQGLAVPNRHGRLSDRPRGSRQPVWPQPPSPRDRLAPDAGPGNRLAECPHAYAVADGFHAPGEAQAAGLGKQHVVAGGAKPAGHADRAVHPGRFAKPDLRRAGRGVGREDHTHAVDAPGSCRRSWRRCYNRNRPQRPPGMSGSSYSVFGIDRQYASIPLGYNRNQNIDSATLHTSILERALVELTDGSNPVLSQPRTYVAIVDRSPEVSFGLKSVKEEDSFHVILGKW